ncbi:uncharacterized protein LOC126336472 [Schistocerca gregaria]|uniref:uncharacterized protein LOC126336472 n=1 Tax=Schistocerca gregaria TaxID=7010 RepID=UPI00211EEA53|nr:uncharacterized protein LOC126336472 [Schistocerca gregaria]
MEHLNQLIQDNPVLYSTSHPDYMRNKLKDEIWKKVAGELHYSNLLEDSMSATSPSPRRIWSDIWYHFTKMEKKGKCCYCQQIISISSGSNSNLKRHLKSKHPTIPAERCGSRSRSRSPSMDAEIQEIISCESTSTSNEGETAKENWRKLRDCHGDVLRRQKKRVASIDLNPPKAVPKSDEIFSSIYG